MISGNLTPERLASLLAYCKLTELADEEEVQLLIPLFYNAAVGYMENAGVSTPAVGTPRASMYDVCVNFMVLNDWEHRDMQEESDPSENVSFRRRLNQLKMTEPPQDTEPEV